MFTRRKPDRFERARILWGDKRPPKEELEGRKKLLQPALEKLNGKEAFEITEVKADRVLFAKGKELLAARYDLEGGSAKLKEPYQVEPYYKPKAEK